jgi:hypothetical protein
LEKVKYLINTSTNDWDRQTISQTLVPMEAEQIFQIPLQNLMDDDIISWQDTNDGIYMVKSGYNA